MGLGSNRCSGMIVDLLPLRSMTTCRQSLENLLKAFLALIMFTPMIGHSADSLPNPPVPRHMIAVKGTGFTLDDKPFAYTGLSFFNAIYNSSFNANTDSCLAWMRNFQAHGINVLRVWCQWDSACGFVDSSPTCSMYEPDGSLRPVPLGALKSILADADSLGLCVEVVLFSQESDEDKRQISEPADERAVAALTREWALFRNATFQIWNEHSDDRVLPLIGVIRSIDPRRLVTNSAGYAKLLGNDAENAALDYLTPHTMRKGKHWDCAPQEVDALLKKFHKPVVDDEPARNGTKQFGGPESETSPFDHIVHILNVERAGAYSMYHHDMFQTGYGSPATPPSGIPDPDFNPYHHTVFDCLARHEQFSQSADGRRGGNFNQPATAPSDAVK